nr:MAG TPA: hypothetical protein [Caudoviricetes sp.]
MHKLICLNNSFLSLIYLFVFILYCASMFFCLLLCACKS